MLAARRGCGWEGSWAPLSLPAAARLPAPPSARLTDERAARRSRSWRRDGDGAAAATEVGLDSRCLSLALTVLVGAVR